MKMEHPVHAARAGRVVKVSAGVGEQVSDAQTLLVIGPAEGGPPAGSGTVQ
jgi:biotin carboxyl carrier protein